jgi:very-short-patch-repair endonuclease
MKRHRLPAGAVARARRLRRTATDAEELLWYALRERLSSAKFRRQVPFGPYTADFASHGAKLIVEVDGHQHMQASEHDRERTAFLNSEGYQVLRFWNNEVLQNLDGVLTVVASHIPSPLVGEGGPQGRMRGARRRPRAGSPSRHPSPHPSPTRGEGESDNPPDWSL